MRKRVNYTLSILADASGVPFSLRVERQELYKNKHCQYGSASIQTTAGDLGVCAVEFCVARTCHGEGVFTII